MVVKNSTVIFQSTIKTNLYGNTTKDIGFGNGGIKKENFETLDFKIWEGGERSGLKDLIKEYQDIYRIR